MKSLRMNFYIVLMAVVSADSPCNTNMNTSIITPSLQKVITTGKNSDPVMASQANTFDHLICGGQMFVDNSLLIEYLANNEKIVVALPRAFGKSINLNMIETFFKIQLKPQSLDVVPKNETNAYSIFIDGVVHCAHGLTINLKEKFLITDRMTNSELYYHLARYPTIKLNLGTPKHTTNRNAVIQFVRTRIRSSLEAHSYLLRIAAATPEINYFQSKYRELFERLKSDSEDELASVIPDFAVLLHDIFGVPVLFLIDEYDALLNNVFFGTGASKFNAEKRQEIVELFATIFGLPIKQSKTIRYVFATGIMCWRNSGIFSEFSRIKFNTVAGGDANYFYGIGHDIVADLLKKSKYDKPLEDVALHFNGYDFGGETEIIERYNPYAISCLLSYKYALKDARFWTQTGDASELIHRLMKYDHFEGKFMLLLAGQWIRIPVNENVWLTRNNSEMLSQVIRSEPDGTNSNLNQLEDYPDENWGFNVLLAAGYLTKSRGNVDDTNQEGTMLVKIPNSEIRLSLWSEYISILSADKFKDHELTTAREDCSRTLATFLSATNPNLSAFGGTFQKVLDAHLPRTWQIHPNKQMAYENEAIIETVLLSVVNTHLYINGIQLFEVQRQFGYATDRKRPDVVLKTKNRELTIFQLKFANFSCNLFGILEEAKNQAVDYAKWYLEGKKAIYYDVKGVKAIALVVTQQGGKHVVLMRAAYVQLVNGRAAVTTRYPDYIPVKLNPQGRIVALAY